MSRRKIPAALFVAMSMVATGSAHAAVTVYTNALDFAAATTGAAIIRFDGIAVPSPPGFLNFARLPGLTVGGVNFLTPQRGVFVNLNVAGYYHGRWEYAHQYIVNSRNPAAENELDMTFPATCAIALDWDAFAGGQDTVFSLSNGFSATISQSPGLGRPTFLGFVSTTPIAWLSLITRKDNWIVEDVTLAGAAEPALATLSCARWFRCNRPGSIDRSRLGSSATGGVWIFRRFVRGVGSHRPRRRSADAGGAFAPPAGVVRPSAVLSRSCYGSPAPGA